MVYQFTPEDLIYSNYWAKKRYAEMRKRDKKESLEDHWSGTLGEFAVHKGFDLPWTGKYYEGRKTWERRKLNREYDVGPLEIRTIDSDHKGLILRPKKDWLEAPFLLVLLELQKDLLLPKATFLGWVYGKNGVKQRWIKYPYDWYVVPQSHLRRTDDPEFAKIIAKYKACQPQATNTVK